MSSSIGLYTPLEAKDWRPLASPENEADRPSATGNDGGSKAVEVPCVVDRLVTFPASVLASWQSRRYIAPIYADGDSTTPSKLIEEAYRCLGAIPTAASVTLTAVQPQEQELAPSQRQLLVRLLQQTVLSQGALINLPAPGWGPFRHHRKNQDGATVQYEVTRLVPAQPFVRLESSTRCTFIHIGKEKAGADYVAEADERRTKVEENVGGLKAAIRSLRELMLYPVIHAETFSRYGLEPSRGILLCGPPGVGKTLLVKKAVEEARSIINIKMFSINGAEVISGVVGESERALREIFSEARRAVGSERDLAVIFIDEIDALCPHRERASSVESRVVAQLLTLMDGLTSRGGILVVGATNLPNSLDPALRRPGRLDREVSITPPTQEERTEILEVHCRRLPLSSEVSLSKLSPLLVGYVGADIAALCREAAMVRLKQWLSCGGQGRRNDQEDFQDEAQRVQLQDFLSAMEKVGPSSLRGHNARIGPVYWSSIGGLDGVKIQLQKAVEWPLKHPEAFRRLGVRPPRGILLYGPPGCSKTSLVKAAASSSSASFLSLSGADVYSPYLGDAEAAIRRAFDRARSALPCILFLDEIDALVGKRALDGSGKDQGEEVGKRVLSTLLNEMDGIEAAEGLLVIAATNRPDMMDAALLRPGRFDNLLYVRLPDLAARFEILKIHTAKIPLADDVDLQAVATNTDRFSGAELESLCREAAILSLRSHIRAEQVQQQHFLSALAAISPQASDDDLRGYESFEMRAGGARA